MVAFDVGRRCVKGFCVKPRIMKIPTWRALPRASAFLCGLWQFGHGCASVWPPSHLKSSLRKRSGVDGLGLQLLGIRVLVCFRRLHRQSLCGSLWSVASLWKYVSIRSLGIRSHHGCETGIVRSGDQRDVMGIRLRVCKSLWWWECSDQGASSSENCVGRAFTLQVLH